MISTCCPHLTKRKKNLLTIYPTDPLLEILAIPTTPQIVPQPHIAESTINETTVDYLNQEQTTMRTHAFKHHSLLMTEPSPETSPQKQTSSQDDSTNQNQTKPDNWDLMTKSQRRYWYNHRNKVD